MLKTRWKRCRGMCRLPCTRRGTAALPQRDDRININFVALLPRVCLNRGIIEGVADAFYVSFIHRSIRRRDNWGRNSTRVEHEAENSEKCSHPYLIAIVRNNEAYLSCSPHVRRKGIKPVNWRVETMVNRFSIRSSRKQPWYAPTVKNHFEIIFLIVASSIFVISWNFVDTIILIGFFVKEFFF